MKKILIVVDMQNEFIDGALGTKEAVAIVPKVEEKIRNFDGEVFFTRDTHETYYLETQEGKNLPVKHCIRDTEGWQIRKELLTDRWFLYQSDSVYSLQLLYPHVSRQELR